MEKDELRETMQDIRIGDILLNHFASDDNPAKRSIVVSITPTVVVSVYAYKGRINKSNYAQKDVRWNKKFEIIGHCDICGIIRDILYETLFNSYD